MSKRARHISTRRDLDAAVLESAIADLPGYPSAASAGLLNQVDIASVATCLDAAEIDHIHVRLTGVQVTGIEHWATVALPERDLFAENVDLEGAWVIDRTTARFASFTDSTTVWQWHEWLAEVGSAVDPAGVVVEFADQPGQEQYIAL